MLSSTKTKSSPPPLNGADSLDATTSPELRERRLHDLLGEYGVDLSNIGAEDREVVEELARYIVKIELWIDDGDREAEAWMTKRTQLRSWVASSRAMLQERVHKINPPPKWPLLEMVLVVHVVVLIASCLFASYASLRSHPIWWYGMSLHPLWFWGASIGLAMMGNALTSAGPSVGDRRTSSVFRSILTLAKWIFFFHLVTALVSKNTLQSLHDVL